MRKEGGSSLDISMLWPAEQAYSVSMEKKRRTGGGKVHWQPAYSFYHLTDSLAGKPTTRKRQQHHR